MAVTVTFLRQDARPASPAPALPEGAFILRAARPSVAFYRYLYDTVGAPWVWWLRRTLPDSELAAILADPHLALHVLMVHGEPAGFYELTGAPGGPVNLAYFGLMPWAIGRGLGTALLRAAIDAAWARGATYLTVNTCTADHPRALPNYHQAGFRTLRDVREIWDIPARLGLRIPEHLRA